MSDRLKEIADRAEKATPGPWTVEWDGDNYAERFEEARWPWRIKGVCNLVEENEQNPVADGEFIAAAREDIPWLLAEVERLRNRPALIPFTGEDVLPE